VRRLEELVGWRELLGLLVLAAWVVWSTVVTVALDGTWAGWVPYALSPVVLVAGVAAGTGLARRSASTGTATALLLLGGGLVLGVLLTAEPGKEPTGYANANAAVAVQAVAMCGLALLVSPAHHRRSLGVALGLAALATALNRSAAGVALVVPVIIVTALAAWRRPSRRAWARVAVVLGSTTGAAAAVVVVRSARDAPLPAWAVRLFDPVRKRLWHDASALWEARPLTGSGPGSFRGATALAADPDTLSAHSAVLQVGSETGWVGVAFLGLVGLGGLLWAARGRPAAAVVAVSAWTALLVHIQVDHLLEFGSVVFAAGLVVGWAGATGRSEELDVAERQPPVARWRR
jgi:hypothetical protein